MHNTIWSVGPETHDQSCHKIIFKFMLAVALKGCKIYTVRIWPQLVKEMFINAMEVT